MVRDKSAQLALQYLEYLVLYENEKQPSFHDNLIGLYISDISATESPTSLKKLGDFLEQEPFYYDPAVVLAALSKGFFAFVDYILVS